MSSSDKGSVLVVGVGASRGLGAAIARRFAKGGHPVVIAGRNAEKLAKVEQEIRASGAKVVVVTGDAASPADSGPRRHPSSIGCRRPARLG